MPKYRVTEVVPPRGSANWARKPGPSERTLAGRFGAGVGKFDRVPLGRPRDGFVLGPGHTLDGLAQRRPCDPVAIRLQGPAPKAHGSLVTDIMIDEARAGRTAPVVHHTRSLAHHARHAAATHEVAHSIPVSAEVLHAAPAAEEAVPASGDLSSDRLHHLIFGTFTPGGYATEESVIAAVLGHDVEPSPRAEHPTLLRDVDHEGLQGHDHATHGLRFPVAATRADDHATRAAFAAHVAQHGGTMVVDVEAVVDGVPAKAGDPLEDYLSYVTPSRREVSSAAGSFRQADGSYLSLRHLSRSGLAVAAPVSNTAGAAYYPVEAEPANVRELDALRVAAGESEGSLEALFGYADLIVGWTVTSDDLESQIEVGRESGVARDGLLALGMTPKQFAKVYFDRRDESVALVADLRAARITPEDFVQRFKDLDEQLRVEAASAGEMAGGDGHNPKQHEAQQEAGA